MLKLEEYLKAAQNNKISEFAIQYGLELIIFDNLFARYGRKELEEEIKKSIDEQAIPDDEFKEMAVEFLDIFTKGMKSKYDSYRIRMSLVQLNTTFENYLYKFAQYWLEKRPGILDECDIKFKDLRLSAKDELILQKIDDFIHDNLLKNDYKQILTSINKRFNIEINYTINEFDELNKFYAIRNTIVHSNGIVDRRFKLKFPETDYKLGDELNLTDEFVETIERLLLKIILKIDKLLVSHYPELIIELKQNKKPTFKPLKLE